jgi:hypothetical protein
MGAPKSPTRQKIAQDPKAKAFIDSVGRDSKESNRTYVLNANENTN